MKKTVAVILLIAIAACMSACSFTGEETEQPPELLPAAGVAADKFTVHREDVCVPQMHEAYVAPYVEKLACTKDAVVLTVDVVSGQQVKQGDRLVTFDLTDTLKRIQELEEQIAQRAATFEIDDEIARLRIEMLENDAKYLEQKGYSKTTVELKRLEKQQAELDLKHAQELREPETLALNEELAALKEIAANDGIYAPFDGRVGNIISVQAGDTVYAGDEIIYLADDTRLSISTEYISDSQWADADGGAYALIGDSRYEIERVPVDKSEYLSTVLAGGKYYCSFNIVSPDNWTEQVHAGDYCAIVLNTRYYPDQLVIPVNSVLSDAQGKYVYIENEQGERERRYIKVHILGTAIYSMVLEGLEEGDVIYVTDK